MTMPYAEFDRSRLDVRPLAERHDDLEISVVRDLVAAENPFPALDAVADRVRRATARGSAVMLMMGAHVLRSGVQRYLIDMMERGWISCLSLNGGGMIHDYELSFRGSTTESVARYISSGQFGLWQETGRLNDIVSAGYARGMGLGEAVGRAILEGDHPHAGLSVLAAGVRLGIPVTVHVGIGYDIVHEHPNCDGAAYGATSYTDFLRFAACVEKLEGGVVMNFGSAVMAPEVYLKALAMARNVAHARGARIAGFTTLVCDLLTLPADFRAEAPRDSAAYYYRPWKTMLVRTVADGGESHYVQGFHATTVPALWTRIQASRNLEEKT